MGRLGALTLAPAGAAPRTQRGGAALACQHASQRGHQWQQHHRAAQLAHVLVHGPEEEAGVPRWGSEEFSGGSEPARGGLPGNGACCGVGSGARGGGCVCVSMRACTHHIWRVCMHRALLLNPFTLDVTASTSTLQFLVPVMSVTCHSRPFNAGMHRALSHCSGSANITGTTLCCRPEILLSSTLQLFPHSPTSNACPSSSHLHISFLTPQLHTKPTGDPVDLRCHSST